MGKEIQWNYTGVVIGRLDPNELEHLIVHCKECTPQLIEKLVRWLRSIESTTCDKLVVSLPLTKEEKAQVKSLHWKVQ